MTTAEVLDHYISRRDRMTAHLAAYVVAGLHFGRYPTAVHLDPSTAGGLPVGVEHAASFALLVRQTEAPLRDDEAERYVRSVRDDALVTVSGRSAEIALGVSTEDEATAAAADYLATALADLRTAFDEPDAGDALYEAVVTADALFARPDVLRVLRVVDEDLKQKARAGVETVDIEEFNAFLHELVDGADSFAAAGPGGPD